MLWWKIILFLSLNIILACNSYWLSFGLCSHVHCRLNVYLWKVSWTKGILCIVHPRGACRSFMSVHTWTYLHTSHSQMPTVFFPSFCLLSNLMCIFFVVKFAVLVKVSSLKFWCWGGYCQVGIWQFLSFPMCQYVLKRFLNIYTALEWSETYLCLIIHLTFTGWTSWTTSWATG
jgi:hypothetical protein